MWYDLMFQERKEIEFLTVDFDFIISPDHFIEWLKMEGEHITGDYSVDVCSMCEYSCLYVAMLLFDVELKGDMKIYYGKFGFSEHYWLGYQYKGEEYFIDLTLQQFINTSPKLVITKSMNQRISGSYSYLTEGEPIRDYVERKVGFKYYVNPKTMEKPPQYVWNDLISSKTIITDYLI